MAMKEPSRRTVLAAVALGLAAPQLVRAQAPRPFRFGLTPVFLDNHWNLLEMLRHEIGRGVGVPVDLVQRRTYKEIVALLLIGEIDAAWLCGYPLLQHADRLTAVAAPVWRGSSDYQSYLIAPAGREVAGLAGLQGDIHAYSDPDSNSGFLVTVSEIVKLGARPEAFFASSFFTFGHRNVVRAVAQRLAMSGSVDGYVWEALAEIEPALTAATQVVWKSEWFGFPPVVVQSEAANTPLIEAFAQTLFSMEEHLVGREVLRLLRLDGFGPVAPGSFDAIAARMRLLADRA